MMTDREYRYMLAKYAGKASRLVCPNCGRRDLVPYIDTETGDIIDETCGRCNHESSCGYHLTPAQYFQQHPEARPQGDAWRQPNYYPRTTRKRIETAPRKKQNTPVNVLPKDLVDKSVNLKYKSNLVKYLNTILDPIIVQDLILGYHLGVTKARETIFYEIDKQGRYRGGKLIQYDATTGHRIKDSALPVNWLHPRLIRDGVLPKDWQMSQVLFGEHLLDKYPEKIVAVVEAEKTAVICAGIDPDCVWVAVGGKNQFGDKLDVLQGRKILVYPDVDAFDEWTEWFQEHPYLNATVSDYLELNCTPEEREAQVDIADLLIKWKLGRDATSASVQVASQPEPSAPAVQPTNPVLHDIARYFSPEVIPEVEALIEDLDLIPVSVSYQKPNNNADSNR